jgi:dolichyl-phosphate-mannose-protein mannosyltransferase
VSTSEQAPSRADSGLPRRWARPHLGLVSGGLFLFTLCFRGWSIGRPRTYLFDEIFYANDALDLFTHGAERTFVGHPPLAKWLISIGFATGRFSPTTWRLSALLAGALVVVLVFLCAERLSGSIFVGLVASAFVLTDGIAHFAGRYAHLDGFVVLFSTGALAVLVLSRSRALGYGIAVLVGGLCGAALACKWSALPLIPLAAAICFVRGRRGGTTGRALALAAASVGAGFIVYFGSYTPWIIGGAPYGNCEVEECSESAWQRVAQLPSIQMEMYRSDRKLERPGTNRDPAWTWALQNHPFGAKVYLCDVRQGEHCVAAPSEPLIHKVRGNPVLWMLTVPLFLGSAVLAHWRRRRIPGVGLAFVWAFAMWLPWLRESRVYLYYAAPVVPALAIAVTLVTADLLPRRIRPLLTMGALAAGAFIFVWHRTGAPWAI